MQKCYSIKTNYFLLLSCLFFLNGMAQDPDIDLLRQYKVIEKSFPERKVEFLKPKKKTLLNTINPFRLLFGGLLYTYQKTISSQLSRQCPYSVSCSSFSKQCIQKFGLFKGLALSCDRMTRCTKLASFDVKATNIDLRFNQIIDPPNFYLHLHDDNLLPLSLKQEDAVK